MLELNIFCIWLVVAIRISTEETTSSPVSYTSNGNNWNADISNETNMTPTTSTPVPYSTTPNPTSMTNKVINCTTDQNILCSVCEFLIHFERPGLVFGIGVAGLVVLIALAVIIAVCCDRKLRKRKLPVSDHPTEANREATSSERLVRQGDEHPYYNESTTAAIKHSEPKESMPYSTVYELAKQVPGEHLNAADASDGCPYAEVARGQKLGPNHSNSANYTSEYADTAAIQRDVGLTRMPASGGYEEAVDPNLRDSNENRWEESNPYDAAMAVDGNALNQRGTGRRGEAMHMQNCGMPTLDEDITLIDNFIYSNAQGIQRL